MTEKTPCDNPRNSVVLSVDGGVGPSYFGLKELVPLASPSVSLARGEGVGYFAHTEAVQFRAGFPGAAWQ
jgi:hypothetical protein